MKNSLRFVSAVLAAILCGTAFSACANEVKPPVSEVTTDITTDAPLTIAPVTTEATETTEAPTTETSDISTTTDAITTEGAETSDTPATSPSTTAAPATDAPSVTTEAPATVDPVTTEVSVATEVPVSTQVAVTTDALVTTEVPVTTEPEQEEIIDTYGKSLAEILYKTDSGEVKIKGNSSFSLPCAGMYLVDRTRPDAPPTFVVKESPKLDRGPRVHTSSNTKLYPEFRPDRYVDKDGNTIDLTYKKDEGTLAGMKCHSAISGDNYYIVTVFSDNTYNVSEIPGEVITIDYYNKDIGFLICKSNDAIFNAYCTYDGGKTFEFLFKLCKENRDYRNPQLYVTNTGMFYVTINPRLMGNSGSWEIVFELEQGKIVKSDNVDLNSVYLRNGIEQNVYLLFDNNIGIWARYQSHYISDRDPVPELHYIYYYISTDGGKTWQIYDPAIVGITIEETVYH